MNVLPKIYTLKDEAQTELYIWLDKDLRPLPKNQDGSVDEYGDGLVDNEIDALRHAYVSGVYTLEYSEDTAEILGRLNEFSSASSSANSVGAENMDLWNNSIGRLKAKKSKTRRDLYESLLKALKEGELIIDPNDPRKFRGLRHIKQRRKSFVIKILENRTGANIEFLDVRRKIVLTKEMFILRIKEGKYPGYAVRKHDQGEFPYSTRDKYRFNNLG